LEVRSPGLTAREESIFQPSMRRVDRRTTTVCRAQESDTTIAVLQGIDAIPA
jgi:hypothetical protein